MGYAVNTEDSIEYPTSSKKHNRNTSREAFATSPDAGRSPYTTSAPPSTFKNKSQAPFRPMNVYKKAKGETVRLMDKAKWVSKDLSMDLGRWRRQRFN